MLSMRPCDLGTAFLGTFLAVEKSTSTAGANTGNISIEQSTYTLSQTFKHN